ncbi:MAG: hypothetical protein C5B50_11690 [Verrucomicrobia bacterium]|nr:MAG: hypothetical protein C5B50_11690 [Verrucomicrobiota bacterium]
MLSGPFISLRTERGIYAASRLERTEAPGLSGPFISLRTVKRHKCRAPAQWQYQDAPPGQIEPKTSLAN